MSRLLFLSCFLLISSSIFAKNVVVFVDLKSGEALEEDLYSAIDFIDLANLKAFGFEKLTFVRLEAAKSSYDLKTFDPTAFIDINAEAESFGLIRLMNNLATLKGITKDDVIIIFSDMSYENRKANINTRGLLLNDGWVSSDNSPLHSFFSNYAKKRPLNDARVLVIDPIKDIVYVKNRRRLMANVFEKLGGNLVFYGSLNQDETLLGESVKNISTPEWKLKRVPLRQEKILMINHKPVEYDISG